MTVAGLTTIKSSHPPSETMDRLEAAVKAKGLTVFARIDHAAGAVCGRPLVAADRGPDLRKCQRRHAADAGRADHRDRPSAQGAGLAGRAGETWLSWNDPAWLAARHGVSGAEAVTSKLVALLEDLAESATAA